jgi:fatty acid desaturase
MNSIPGEVCIPNISTKERWKRLASGLVMEVLCLAGLTVLISIHASVWWRLLLFPLFAGAASGYFQWRDKT